MKELIEKRTETQKTFDLGEGNYQAVISAKPVHYKKKGLWLPFSNEVSHDTVKERSYTAHLLDVGKIGYKGINKQNGEELYLELDGEYSFPEVIGNKVTYKNVAPDTDFRLIFKKNKILAMVILRSAQAPTEFRYNVDNQKKINRGWDKTGRAIQLETKEQDGVVIQKFLGKALDIDPTTRIRSWSDDIQYPVFIDPTSTFVEKSGTLWYYDGYVKKSSGGGTGISLNSFASVARVGGETDGPTTNTTTRTMAPYMVFQVSGISNSATITSATLQLYMKWTKVASGTTLAYENVQPTSGDKVQAWLYNGAGPTAAIQSDRFSLRPTSSITSYKPLSSNKIITHTGMTQAFSGFDTDWNWNGTGFDWKAVSMNVTSKFQTLINTFHYDLNNDCLFVLSAGGINHLAASTPTSINVNHTGAIMHVALKSHAQPDPKLIVIYGEGGGSPSPMCIVFS